MKKIKGLTIVAIIALAMTGCTNTSDAIVQNQNAEIIQLQEVRAKILMRETKSVMELKTKEADLILVNNQIKQAMETAKEAQELSNQQYSQKGKTALGIGAAILGGAAVIHEITK
ncbi:MAG: hypothetical protein ACRC0Y_09660 [Fusobacteriaceae bacterium]